MLACWRLVCDVSWSCHLGTLFWTGETATRPAPVECHWAMAHGGLSDKSSRPDAAGSLVVGYRRLMWNDLQLCLVV